jgi:hypothetical protein
MAATGCNNSQPKEKPESWEKEENARSYRKPAIKSRF